MSQVRTRKRPAPGASPLSQTQQQAPSSPHDPALGWQSPETLNVNGAYQDPSFYGSQAHNAYPQMQPMHQSQSTNQLARRSPNQPLIPIQNYTGAGNGPWQVNQSATSIPSDNEWSVQYDDLDQKALVAKGDAESKRKQIPPFVQKLSSFLDESRNTDLIRWSESGDSFIVVDEDEFAKTLIPELFKHNNYASFVRQLNMYGFHKKVGLSDNSMRASERKNKNPSEYSNPYFKRGRPNLLWLIQKPKNTSSKSGAKGGSRTKQEDHDEEVDETFGRDNSPTSTNMDQLDDGMGVRGGRQNLLTMGNTPTALPQDELANVQRELANIRQNQMKIKNMLEATRREHQQLYGQAKAFQDQHEKHDNSINAILTFLATVYNKNLNSGQGGMGDMFPGAIRPNEQEHGNVVDMGDFRDQSMESNTPQPFRRVPFLIEDGKKPQAPPEQSRQPSKGQARPPRNGKPSQYNQSPLSPAVQELSDHTASNRSSESPQIKYETLPNDDTQIPKADIMSMLNNATAQNTNSFPPKGPMDFSEALSHLQHSGGNTPLTPGQRQSMLQLMGDEYQSPNANVNNALAFSSALSPSNGLASQAHFDQTTHDLDQLGHIIREQGNNINNLSNTLTPLSPSGSIPGVSNEANYQGPSGLDLLDLDNIFNDDGYFDEGTGEANLNFDNGDLPDFDFSTDDTGAGATEGKGVDDQAGRVDEVLSSESTSPANTAGTADEKDEVGGLGKKRRVR
ncbi:MAG: hypothetical protein Q9217_002637 [Psora testacea]